MQFSAPPPLASFTCEVARMSSRKRKLWPAAKDTITGKLVLSSWVSWARPPVHLQHSRSLYYLNCWMIHILRSKPLPRGAIGFLASLRHVAPPAVGKRVLELSRAPEPEVRAAVASTLGFFDMPEAAQVLRTLCGDDDGSVNDAAEFALDLHLNRRP